MQQHPTIKPVAITKQQLTMQPSLVHWKALYSPLLPAFHHQLAAAPAAATPNTNDDNDPTANNGTTTTTTRQTTEEEDDDDAIRYLAEWGGDVGKAVAHCRETQEWRRTALPIPRSEEVLRTVQTHKLLFLGFDRVGRPVCYYRTRLHDPKAFTPEETGAWGGLAGWLGGVGGYCAGGIDGSRSHLYIRTQSGPWCTSMRSCKPWRGGRDSRASRRRCAWWWTAPRGSPPTSTSRYVVVVVGWVG